MVAHIVLGFVVTKETSLRALFPDIAEEWDYAKNSETPDDVAPQSHAKNGGFVLLDTALKVPLHIELHCCLVK